MSASNATASANLANVTTTKKKAPMAPTRSKITATHPPTSVMVNSAITALNTRGGSSLQAIKKFVIGNYKLDQERFNPLIKRYLKSATESGVLIRTKGVGAAGSFKLAVKTEAKPKKKTTPPKESGKKEAKEGKVAESKAAKPSKGSRASEKKAVKPKVTSKPPTSPKKPKVKTVKSPKTKAAAKPKKVAKK